MYWLTIQLKIQLTTDLRLYYCLPLRFLTVDPVDDVSVEVPIGVPIGVPIESPIVPSGGALDCSHVVTLGQGTPPFHVCSTPAQRTSLFFYLLLGISHC